MIIKRRGGDKKTDTDIIAEVPYIKRPNIVGIETVEGEELYFDAEGKYYRPALFDAMFTVTIYVGAVKHYSYKGQNPNHLRESRD